jgi:L-lysine 6-transaminase
MSKYIKNNNKKIAAIITEIIQSEGGNNFMSERFWKFLRDICYKYDILLIADEVQTGMMATGKVWAYEHLGREPDILCFGKKAQTCGIISTGRIDDVKNHVFKLSSRINSTFGGNLTDFFRCKKYLEIIEKYNYMYNAEISGIYLLKELGRVPLINNVRGKGLIIAFDLPNKRLRNLVIDKLMELNVLVLPCGKNSIRLRPKLDIEKKHIDEFIFKLECVIKNLSKGSVFDLSKGSDFDFSKESAFDLSKESAFDLSKESVFDLSKESAFASK